MNFLFKLFIIGLILYLLSRSPGIIKLFVLLVQTVGGYTWACIKEHPVFFAIGIILIYGMNSRKKIRS
jgi:hypothetical protein